MKWKENCFQNSDKKRTSEENLGVKKKKRASTKQEIERIYIEMHISNLPCKSGFCATPPSVSLRAGFLSSLVAIITWLCSCPGVNRCIRVCTKVYTNVYYRYAHMQAILSLYSKM